MGVPLVCGVHGISDGCDCCVSQDVCRCYTRSLPRVLLECVSGTLFWMMETRNKKVILVMNIPTPGKCSFTGRRILSIYNKIDLNELDYDYVE
jgi:hypothetical protein